MYRISYSISGNSLLQHILQHILRYIVKHVLVGTYCRAVARGWVCPHYGAHVKDPSLTDSHRLSPSSCADSPSQPTLSHDWSEQLTVDPPHNYSLLGLESKFRGRNPTLVAPSLTANPTASRQLHLTTHHPTTTPNNPPTNHTKWLIVAALLLAAVVSDLAAVTVDVDVVAAVAVVAASPRRRNGSP